MPAATTRIGPTVEIMPTPRPAMMLVAGTGLARLGDRLDGLVVVGAVVLGDLADRDTGHETDHDGAEVPQASHLGRDERPPVEQAEHGDDLEGGGDVGAGVQWQRGGCRPPSREPRTDR